MVLALIIVVAVALFVTYYATSGQTAKFSAAQCYILYYQDLDGDGFGNVRTQMSACLPPRGYVTNPYDCSDTDKLIYPGSTEVCGDFKDNNCNGKIDEDCALQTGTIRGRLKNICTGSGVPTPIYLDGQRVTDSDERGDYRLAAAVGKHNFKIQMGNQNGLVKYESDQSANYATEINEEVTLDRRGQIATKNYDFETGRGIRLHTNVQDVVISYIGAQTLDCSKPEGCWLGSAPVGPFSVTVQHAGQSKTVDTTVERCREKDVTVNF